MFEPIQVIPETEFDQRVLEIEESKKYKFIHEHK